MMKRVFSLFLAFFLILAVPVSAAQMPRMVDAADLLSEETEQELLDRLDRISEELRADVVIVTMESIGDYSADQVVEAFYDEYGYGYGPDRDGVVLLLAMQEREYRILSNGFAATAITTRDIDVISDHIVEELSAGEYPEAFMEFISLCSYEIEGERNGFPFEFGKNLLIALAVGVVAALIAVGIMAAQLRSVARRHNASGYTREGSFRLTQSSDLYLYRNVSRRRRQTDTSGSGSRSGGGGGRNIGGGRF